MNALMIATYFMFAIILFYILNYFDNNNKNSNIIHIVLPVIYIIILASIIRSVDLKDWNDFLFLVPIFELVIRLFYVKGILRQESLVNNNYYLKIYSLTILLSYFVNSIFISKVENVFPTAEEMRTGIWFLIIIFCYSLMKENIKVDISKDKATFIEKKQEYTVVSYARFKNLYNDVIETEYKELIPVVYAIMIYENYRRPAFFRKLDKFKFHLKPRTMRMGIMQVASKKEIDDEKSIELAIKNLEKYLLKLRENKKTKNNTIDIREVIKNYYSREDSSDVIDIYNKIIEFNRW